MSFLGINIAGSALDAFQTAEDVTAQNVANVQTPGASRQLVELGQLPPITGLPGYPTQINPGQQGTGVLVTAIKRVHQDSYDALFRGATSSQNFYSAQSGILSALQSSFGEPSNGINAAFSNFQTSIQTLANNPQGSAEEQGVLVAANGLVSSITSANAALQSSLTQTQSQATGLITTINNTIDQIAQLNGEIRAAAATGNNPNTYEDQRDELIDTLSTYLPTSTALQADGSTLVTVDGQALVNDSVAYNLATPIIGVNANGTPALQVNFVTPPTPVNPPAINITGGQLGGLLDTYNNKLIPYGNQLNDFANALSTESDRLTQAGYDATGTAGGQLFSPVVIQLPISAGNLQVGILTPSEVPTSLATTNAGTLVVPLNSGNTTVDTTGLIVGNATLANPPAADINGQLTVTDDGINQIYNYSTVNASTLSTAAVAVGATAIAVNSVAGFVVGQNIVYGSGADQELVNVTGIGPGNVIDISATVNAHAAGESIGGNATTIDGFINSFNAEHFGVTASYDSTSQTVVFARDPTNIDLVHRAAMQAAGGSTTPAFTIQDSNIVNAGGPPPVPPPNPPLGTPSTAILTSLGAQQISGVQQDNTNALGVTNGADANAMLNLFSADYGVPSLQTTSATAIPLLPPLPRTVTISPGTPGAFAQTDVGDVLTIDAGSVNQENVTVTAVNRLTGQISFVAKNPHLVAGFSISSAQVQPLQKYYANLIANMGQDAANASTGTTTQTSLSASINQVRESTDGIDIDEETQNLVKFQNAYGASAHVMTVLSSMLEDAINLGTGSTF